MARECIRNCPNIASWLAEMGENMLLPINPDVFEEEGSTINQALSWCEASYDCDGPVVQPVEVAKGIIRRRTEIENQWICGWRERSPVQDT